MSETSLPADVGVVVIGRNEGERLERCLKSLVTQTQGLIVYVDSGSTDNSVAFARSLDVYVEELDTSIPFTMARGRNTGFQRLMALRPELQYVQFVDGDCEVESTWVPTARAFLQSRQDISVVCGFRRERFPEASIYNRLIDLEWQGAVGEISECGGDAMYRTKVFQQSGGFDETLIAGEEPELCVRIRQAGGVIWRLDEKMVAHDAALYEFSQWWTRAMRGGYAYAEGAVMHGGSPQRHYTKELLRTVVYGLMVPCFWAIAILLGIFVSGLSWLIPVCTLGLVLIYAKPFFGAYRARCQQGNSRKDALLYAVFSTLAKFPEAQGVLKYFINRARGKRTGLIEYKAPSS